MAARTDAARVLTLFALSLLATHARADEPSGAAEPSRFRILEHGYRFAWFDQHGRGFQSQAGPDVGPGSEWIRVLQPAAYTRVAHGENVIWDVGLQVDIVTSASADALDAVTMASRTNEAGTLDVQATWRASEDDVLSFRGAGHLEEPLRSGSLGIAYTRELAEDNATVSVSVNGTVDRFDTIQPSGYTPGIAWRQAWNANLSVSQILSPTTIGSLSYGVTNQRGTLEQTWNSSPVVPCGVPFPCDARVGEIFPRTRLRHAVRATLAQRLPLTDTTLRLAYRYYADDFDVHANTLEAEMVQGLASPFSLSLRYRMHRQTAASFYVDRLPSELRDVDAPRTSDSDLDAFTARSVGARLDLVLPGGRGYHDVDVSYTYYARTNGLDIHLVGMGYRRVY